jgi:hypothetical protein
VIPSRGHCDGVTLMSVFQTKWKGTLKSWWIPVLVVDHLTRINAGHQDSQNLLSNSPGFVSPGGGVFLPVIIKSRNTLYALCLSVGADLFSNLFKIGNKNT